MADPPNNIIRFPTFHRVDIEYGNTRRMFYRLSGHEPVKCTMAEWEQELLRRGRSQQGDDPWRVALTTIGQVDISTVFLGLDHNFFGGKPLLFETMVFGGDNNEYQNRCSTWEEAESMHQLAVEMVRLKYGVK